MASACIVKFPVYTLATTRGHTQVSTLQAALCGKLLFVHVFAVCTRDRRNEQAALPTSSPSKVHPFALLNRNSDKRKLPQKGLL